MKANLIEEQDGSTSSRRFMAILLTVCFFILGASALIIGLILKLEFNQWLFFAIAAPLSLAVVWGLFMFGLINATNLAEIVGKKKDEN